MEKDLQMFERKERSLIMMIKQYRKRLRNKLKEYLYHYDKNLFEEQEYIMKSYCEDVYKLATEILKWL